MALRFIDLFCGLGGFRIAFERQGAKCIFSSDIDKAAQETYAMNFGEVPAGDIKEVNAKDIPDFDIICAGFPCQPFSLAGKRMGFEDTRGTLFFEVLRIIKEKRPKAFFLENVAGLTNHDKGRTLQIIMDSLNDAGYYATYKLLNAKEYGVPQNRNRWYCVGVRKDLTSEDNFNNYDFYPQKRELLRTLNDIVDLKLDDESYSSSEIAIRNIKKHINEKVNEKIKSNMIVLANNVRPSRVFFATEGISPCLTAKMGTGGNNVPIVVNTMRKLTEKECLEIMGFPSDYKIKKNKSQSYKQAGNSVIVPILTEIAHNLTSFLVSLER